MIGSHDAGVCIVGDNPAARLSFGHPVGGPSTRVGGLLAPWGSPSLLWGSLPLLVAWSVRITGLWPLSAGPWGCFRVLLSFVRRSRRLLCAFFWFAPSPPPGPPFLFPPCQGALLLAAGCPSCSYSFLVLGFPFGVRKTLKTSICGPGRTLLAMSSQADHDQEPSAKLQKMPCRSAQHF